MTVITFAKNNSFTTSFDIRRSDRSRSPLAFRRAFAADASRSIPIRAPLWIERGILCAAVMSAFAMLAIVFFGTRASIMILSTARTDREITRIESEVERLRVETLMRSNPQFIFERARMLQLITNDDAHYVSLGIPNELALGRSQAAETAK